MRNLSWQERAACVGKNTNLFFPVRGQNFHAEARKVCFACPVRMECLGYALERNIKSGIWGGRTEKERRGMRTGWKAAV